MDVNLAIELYFSDIISLNFHSIAKNNWRQLYSPNKVIILHAWANMNLNKYKQVKNATNDPLRINRTAQIYVENGKFD